MKIGLTYDLREDYNIEKTSEVFADFCNPDEIEYLANAIRANGHDITMIGNMFKLNELIKNNNLDCDLVFIEDEGIMSRNREAIVPALLELNKIPYVGTDAYAMGLSQNKFHTKLVAKFLGINVPKYIYVYYNQENLENYLCNQINQNKMSFPMVVKPNAEGYSMGVFLVNDIDEMINKINFNFSNYHQEVLCEQYIKGMEVYAPIVGSGEASYVLNIGACKYINGNDIDIFSLKDKCFTKIIDKIALISEETKNCIIEWSLKLYKHLNCFDFGRIDYKIDSNGIPYFLEINPRPGLTQNGPYESCANSIGKSYTEIISEIINSAAKRYNLKEK